MLLHVNLLLVIYQGSKGISTSPIMVHNFTTFVDYDELCLDTQLNVPTNQNSEKVPKVVQLNVPSLPSYFLYVKREQWSLLILPTPPLHELILAFVISNL